MNEGKMEGRNEQGREPKAMLSGPGGHVLTMLNFGKHGQAFASKVVEHMCWELAGGMSNSDSRFETDGLQCIPLLSAWCLLHAAGGDCNSLIDSLQISLSDPYVCP